MVAIDNRLYLNVDTAKLVYSSKFGQSTLPRRNNMRMTAQEYKEFITLFGLQMEWTRKFMNTGYFKYGIPVPEILTLREFLFIAST